MLAKPYLYYWIVDIVNQTENKKIKDILKYTKEGLSRPDIALMTNLSPRTVYKYQKLFGKV